MFENFSGDALVGEIEASQRQESALMAHRCGAIAELLAVRTAEAEEADPDPGYSMITGFARTTAEVSAAMNMSPRGAQHLVSQAEALDARLPKVAALLAAMAQVRGSLPATAGAVFDKRLSEMATSVCAKDSRTIAQRRADALSALCEGRTLACDCGQPDCAARAHASESAAGGVQTVINVIATEATVTGDSDQPGYLEGYGVIDAEQVRELADTATIRPVECPTVSEDEALRYQPSAALERWIRCRDMTCRFPGCDRKAAICDLDHTTPFNQADPSLGGLTVPWDLACYCREHHRLKTFHGGLGGWRDEQLPDGTIVWTSPTGRMYKTTPDGYDLFPQLREACRAPTLRKRSRSKEQAKRVARARGKLREQRPVNIETRRINYARNREIELRRWRNQSRRMLILFKGKQQSTGPWCTWVNDPFEPEELPPDWQPPPPPPHTLDDDPPF